MNLEMHPLCETMDGNDQPDETLVGYVRQDAIEVLKWSDIPRAGAAKRIRQLNLVMEVTREIANKKS